MIMCVSNSNSPQIDSTQNMSDDSIPSNASGLLPVISLTWKKNASKYIRERGILKKNIFDSYNLCVNKFLLIISVAMIIIVVTKSCCYFRSLCVMCFLLTDRSIWISRHWKMENLICYCRMVDFCKKCYFFPLSENG